MGRLETGPAAAPQRSTRAEALALEIERRIAEGALAADERIGTKGEIHCAFGVGVGTVNVAVRLLESRGLIAAKPGPGGGIFVAGTAAPVRLSRAIVGFRAADVPVGDWLAVQAALEPEVDREAASFRDAADVRDLRRIVLRMEDCVSRPERLFELGLELRRREARICRNATLRGLYLTLLDQAREGIGRGYRAPGFDPGKCVEGHRLLVEAIAAGRAV
jgi:DNA-binding FadR family transcriptional regulator